MDKSTVRDDLKPKISGDAVPVLMKVISDTIITLIDQRRNDETSKLYDQLYRILVSNLGIGWSAHVIKDGRFSGDIPHVDQTLVRVMYKQFTVTVYRGGYNPNHMMSMGGLDASISMTTKSVTTREQQVALQCVKSLRSKDPRLSTQILTDWVHQMDRECGGRWQIQVNDHPFPTAFQHDAQMIIIKTLTFQVMFQKM